MKEYEQWSDAERFAELRKYTPGQTLSDTELDHIRKVDAIDDNIDRTMESYARFLHDGDYEKYMPLIDMDKTSLEYLALQIELQAERVRLLWIELRFVKFYSNDWAKLKSQYYSAHSYLRFLQGCHEKATTGKYEFKPPNEM